MSESQNMSKRQMRREQMRRREVRGRLTWIIVITVIVAIFAVIFVYPQLKPLAEIITPKHVDRPQVDANAAGDSKAPIRIDEYGDFQCPHCRNFYLQTEPQLVEQYVATGKVYFVYHSFGSFIGQESEAAAEAAYCAGDQNKFWEMHDMLFTNQLGENANSFTDRRLRAMASELGLDSGEFNSCLSNGTYTSKVTQDAKDALAAGVQATPSFVMTYVVNGQTKTQLITGAQPIESFQQAIDAAMTEMGK
jgi:protein-disulfide isomerase